jgi:hypothetical protein
MAHFCTPVSCLSGLMGIWHLRRIWKTYIMYVFILLLLILIYPLYIQIFISALRKAEPPVIPRDRLYQFIEDIFHNYAQLYKHHRKLVDDLHEIQRKQHPRINTIAAAIFDAVVNFREAYMEYLPNYPIAAYRFDEEMANNVAFKTFVDVSRLYYILSFEFLHSDFPRAEMCSSPRCSSS